MENQFEIKYLNGLRTEATHLATNTKLITDAPVDNKGQGRSFAPTDLLAVSVGSCMVTTMAIAADQFGLDLGEVTCSVKKEMNKKPRRVAKLDISIVFHDYIPKEHRRNLELSAKLCPASKSLDPQVQKITTFNYKVD
ncbi:MAG: osmotically inducible protein OsmC [Actinobacteria bacterium]|jgi:uncharacterized OsmC-like protein|nr:osmotically inducible protein OsmC [Actinomycetota bacterium]|tara:strand:+ start:7352 stop:7765 length:414 start_codon:yes stop_codon:yes gene_type:complete